MPAAMLKKLMDAGDHNVLDLWRKIKVIGYTGSQKPVRKWVRLRREEPAATTPAKYLNAASSQTPSPTLDLPSAKAMS